MKAKRFGFFLVVAALAFCLSACAPPGSGMKSQQGAGIGAAAGAVIGQLIGQNEAGTWIGAAIGTIVGGAVGSAMDQEDMRRMQQAYERAPDNNRVSWVNPNTGNSYEVIPQQTFNGPSGDPCRTAEVRSTIDGRQETVISKACRDGSGQWIAQN